MVYNASTIPQAARGSLCERTGAVRVLLAVHNVYTEFTSGAARSVRTIMQWLAGDGHVCRALSAAWFEATPGAAMGPHLAQLGITPHRRAVTGGREVLDYTLAGVAVTALGTRERAPNGPDRAEARQYFMLFQDILREFRPDLVLTYGNHPVLIGALHDARAAGATTVRTVRAYGYEHRAWFDDADRVLTNSEYVARHYRERIGLRSAALPSPILWSEVLGPENTRRFLTLVNPSLHKGAALFARLADMLGRARADIPILIVQSGVAAARLDAADGPDLTRYPQIVVSPPLPDTRDLYGLTRLLLVPSVFHEPFGRVAAEAMINGIPTLVSDRGALPETVGDGGIVLPVPEWMAPGSRRIPEAKEVEPWFEAVTRLWDDPAEYQRVATAARATAHRLYDETDLRRRHAAFFTAPGPYPPLFG
jgi:glycosyltransferase involved in cell wall biosynthesis